MKKKIGAGIIAMVLMFMMAGTWVQAQSANFQAQGFYYKAKELHDKKDFPGALPYIVKAKESLKGTNEQLQYLHIMCHVALKDWVNANTELQTYFALLDGTQKSIYFTKTVERLTDDETKALSKAMVDIQEKAGFETSPEGQRLKLRNEIKNLILQLVYEEYSNSKNFDNNTQKGELTEGFYITNEFTFLYSEVFNSTVLKANSHGCRWGEFQKATYSFYDTDIKSVKIINSYDFSIGKGDPALLLEFKKMMKYKQKRINKECVGSELEKSESNSEMERDGLPLRMKSVDVKKVDRINELLKQL